MKRQLMKWEEICVNIIFDKGLIFKINKELMQFNRENKTNNLRLKMYRNYRRLFFFPKKTMNNQQVHEKVLNISKSSEKYKSRPRRVSTSYLLECCCWVY